MITDAFQDAAVRAVGELLRLRGQQVTLTPAVGVVTEKPSGGKDYAPAANRAPQTFYLNDTKSFDGREDSQTDQGLSRKFQFKLVGAADAVVEVGDAWEDDDFKYEVDSVNRANAYQIEALVTAFLKVTGHSFG